MLILLFSWLHFSCGRHCLVTACISTIKICSIVLYQMAPSTWKVQPRKRPNEHFVVVKMDGWINAWMQGCMDAWMHGDACSDQGNDDHKKSAATKTTKSTFCCREFWGAASHQTMARLLWPGGMREAIK